MNEGHACMEQMRLGVFMRAGKLDIKIAVQTGSVGVCIYTSTALTNKIFGYRFNPWLVYPRKE